MVRGGVKGPDLSFGVDGKCDPFPVAFDDSGPTHRCLRILNIRSAMFRRQSLRCEMVRR